MIHKLIEAEDAPKMLHLGSRMKTVNMDGAEPSTGDGIRGFIDDFLEMTEQHPFDNRSRYFVVAGLPIMVELRASNFNSVKSIHLAAIITPPELRGKGESSKILKTLCDLADKHQVKITLTASPIKTQQRGLSAARLKAWYTRFGFVFKDIHGERSPQPV